MTAPESKVARRRVCYAGLNHCGMQALAGNVDYELVAVGMIPSLLRFSLNPCNWLFQLVYALRRTNTHPKAERVLSNLLDLLRPALSSYYRRYFPHLQFACQHRLSVVDLSSNPESQSRLRSMYCDLLIINVWDVISKEVIDCFCAGAINIHPSALPQYCGALPTLWSIRNEDTASAVSFITVYHTVDAGRILLQVPFAITPVYTWNDIEAAVDNIVVDRIASVIRNYLSGQTTGVEQSPEGFSTTALYSAYQRINLANESVREIMNKIPYYPHWDPGTYCYIDWDNIRVHFKRIERTDDAPTHSHETTDHCHISGTALYLQCRDGYLKARLFVDIPFIDSLLLLWCRCLPRHLKRNPLVFRLGELTIGHAVNQLTIYLFEFALYPLMIFWLGLLKGFAVMSTMSFMLSLVTIWFYDWSKRDWLGIEAIKSLKDYAGPNRIGRAMAWILRQSDPVACVLLSLRFDPFIVTVYLRRGRFGGMSRRDWRIFLLSWLIGNAWWSVVCFTGLSAVEWVWNWVKG